MTPFFFLIIMASTTSAIAGQVCFKRAMTNELGLPRSRVFWISSGLIGATAGFFLWLAILPHFPLSYIYPIEAVDRIMLALAASLFLGERLTPRLLLGIGVIAAGTVLVSVT